MTTYIEWSWWGLWLPAESKKNPPKLHFPILTVPPPPPCRYINSPKNQQEQASLHFRFLRDFFHEKKQQHNQIDETIDAALSIIWSIVSLLARVARSSNCQPLCNVLTQYIQYSLLTTNIKKFMKHYLFAPSTLNVSSNFKTVIVQKSTNTFLKYTDRHFYGQIIFYLHCW